MQLNEKHWQFQCHNVHNFITDNTSGLLFIGNCTGKDEKSQGLLSIPNNKQISTFIEFSHAPYLDFLSRKRKIHGHQNSNEEREFTVFSLGD